jgi:hypothetical protein
VSRDNIEYFDTLYTYLLVIHEDDYVLYSIYQGFKISILPISNKDDSKVYNNKMVD